MAWLSFLFLFFFIILYLATYYSSTNEWSIWPLGLHDRWSRKEGVPVSLPVVDTKAIRFISLGSLWVTVHAKHAWKYRNVWVLSSSTVWAVCLFFASVRIGLTLPGRYSFDRFVAYLHSKLISLALSPASKGGFCMFVINWYRQKMFIRRFWAFGCY